MNYFRTALLLAAMTALFMGVGFLIGGQSGMLIALVVAAGMNVFTYWNADRMVLGMYNAREVDARSAPEFHGLVAELARNAGLPMPRVFIIDEMQPNAFATGRDPEHAAVAATTGLLARLNRDEVAGVMAHELAHVRNRDTLIMTMTATIAGAISMLANFGMFFGGGQRDENGNANPLGFVGVLVAALVAPLAAMLVQSAISRTREYAADRAGAEICGQPMALASALAKIAGSAQHEEMVAAEANPATAHMFIINPLSGRRMDNLFSTHPDTANRIEALTELARRMGRTARPMGAAGFGTGPAWSSAAPSGPARAPRGAWGGSRRGPWGGSRRSGDAGPGETGADRRGGPWG